MPVLAGRLVLSNYFGAVARWLIRKAQVRKVWGNRDISLSGKYQKSELTKENTKKFKRSTVWDYIDAFCYISWDMLLKYWDQNCEKIGNLAKQPTLKHWKNHSFDRKNFLNPEQSSNKWHSVLIAAAGVVKKIKRKQKTEST